MYLKVEDTLSVEESFSSAGTDEAGEELSRQPRQIHIHIRDQENRLVTDPYLLDEVLVVHGTHHEVSASRRRHFLPLGGWLCIGL